MTLSSLRPRTGLRATLCFLLCLSLGRSQIGAEPIPAGKPAAYPDWWFTRSVIPRQDQTNQTPAWPGDYRQPEDYAVLNEGQLKTLATAAYDEVQANLHGGAGTAVEEMVKSWYNLSAGALPPAGSRVPKAGTTAYTAINLGQLKKVAQPFYDRLVAEGVCPGAPWSYAPTPADDFAVANLGQAKNLFQFVLGSSVPVSEYGLPEWFEHALGSQAALDLAQGTNPGGPRDPNSDTDGDGLSNAEEYAAGTKYTGAGSTDSDGDGVPDGQDGWPMNAALSPPRVPNTRFAVLPLTDIPAGAQLYGLGDGCQVLYSTYDSATYITSFHLWTPTETKAVSINAYPTGLSPSGKKVAGSVSAQPWESQAAVWDYDTGTTLLPRIDFPTPPFAAGDYWYEFATCVNDAGKVLGRTYQEIQGPPYTTYMSGASWEKSGSAWVGARYGREGGNFSFTPRTFYPTAVNNAGLAVGSAARTLSSGTNFAFDGTGAFPSSGSFERLTADGGENLTTTLNNLSDPWVIDSGGQLRVKIGGVWERPPMATWGALDPMKYATGTVSRINDRCEMLGLFWDTVKHREGNPVRNGHVFNVNDLVDSFWVSTEGLVSINNKGIILAYVTAPGVGTALPALLLPIEVKLRNSGKLTSAPESSVYNATKAYFGGTDDLGALPMGTGRAEMPGEAYVCAVEMVGNVPDVPGLSWYWWRWVSNRSWLITKDGSTWWAGLRTRTPAGGIDDRGSESFIDEVPSLSTGNIYYTDASGIRVTWANIEKNDYVYCEMQFECGVGCIIPGASSTIVKIPLRQRLVVQKVSDSMVAAAAYRGVENATVVGRSDLLMTEAKIKYVVGNNKEVKVHPSANIP